MRELGIDVSQFSSSASAESSVSAESAIAPSSVPVRDDVVHFLNLYNQKQKNKMIKLIDILQDTLEKSLDLSNYFNSLFRDVHLVNGAISFADINILAPIVNKWDMGIDEVLLKGEDEVKSWCEKNLSNLKIFLEELWSLRNKIEVDCSDLGIDESNINLLALKKLTNQL
jgi:hypothetical protein